jgi:hypothetical protein
MAFTYRRLCALVFHDPAVGITDAVAGHLDPCCTVAICILVEGQALCSLLIADNPRTCRSLKNMRRPSAGVVGDGRTYEFVRALRAVTLVDDMSADFYPST